MVVDDGDMDVMHGYRGQLFFEMFFLTQDDVFSS